MRVVDFDELDEMSQSFAKRLFELHPDLQPYARAQDGGHDSRLKWLKVEVPSPAGSSLRGPLYVDTDDEITIALDYWHSHFDWPSNHPDRLKDDALQVIEALLVERVAVVSHWAGDEWAGSALAEVGPDLESEVKRPGWPGASKTVARQITRVRVRSWRGTLDRDIARSRST
jgi:hypothetical protein